MFREIKLVDSDRDPHRFLIRDSSGDITVCHMKKVSFSVKSSPFLASSILLYHAATHNHSHPLASKCIEESFYVDNFLSGSDTVEVVAVRKSTCDLLEKAGMSLPKWRTNSDNF